MQFRDFNQTFQRTNINFPMNDDGSPLSIATNVCENLKWIYGAWLQNKCDEFLSKVVFFGNQTKKWPPNGLKLYYNILCVSVVPCGGCYDGKESTLVIACVLSIPKGQPWVFIPKLRELVQVFYNFWIFVLVSLDRLVFISNSHVLEKISHYNTYLLLWPLIQHFDVVKKNLEIILYIVGGVELYLQYIIIGVPYMPISTLTLHKVPILA